MLCLIQVCLIHTGIQEVALGAELDDRRREAERLAGELSAAREEGAAAAARMAKLEEINTQLIGHHNPKQKVVSMLYVYAYENRNYLLERRSTRGSSATIRPSRR